MQLEDGWRGSRSFNVNFDINLATSVTAVTGQTPVCTQCYCDVRNRLLKFNCDILIRTVEIKISANLIYLYSICTADSCIFPWWVYIFFLILCFWLYNEWHFIIFFFLLTQSSVLEECLNDCKEEIRT